MGTWTGRGIDQQGTAPSTKWARRQFRGDPLKRFQLEQAITTHIQRGLNGIGGSHFAMAGEASSDKALVSIRLLQQYVIDHGFDGVTLIQFKRGTIDMFKTPGFLSQELIDTWEKDLLTNGVFPFVPPMLKISPILAELCSTLALRNFASTF